MQIELNLFKNDWTNQKVLTKSYQINWDSCQNYEESQRFFSGAWKFNRSLIFAFGPIRKIENFIGGTLFFLI